jgi:hypothetical protein
MGIEDAKVLLQWLVKHMPTAFYFRLPPAFTPDLIVHEMSSLMMNAFHSPSVLSGRDFVNYLERPLIDISQAPLAEGGGEVERDLTAATWKQHCVAFDPASAPSEDDLEVWTPQEFLPTVNGKRLIYVMTRDNNEHMPENRRMVHDHRYSTKGDRDPRRPFTEAELKQHCFHIREDRPMPGVLNLDAAQEGQPPMPDNWREVRQRAVHTPALRDAYQNYGMWAVGQRLKKQRILPVGTDDRITVLLDFVLGDFPAEIYNSRELHDLPKGWAHQGRKQLETIKLLSGQSLSPVEPPRMGEADLKIVWFIEHFASNEDHVLIRCNDSDVLYILLLHMERWRRQGRDKMQVFLDTMPMAKDRRHSRFIWLNRLADYLAGRTQGAESLPVGFPRGSRAPLGSYLMSFVALCCGSDYTRKFHFITATKILDALDKKDGWALLTDLLNESFVINIDLTRKLYGSLGGYARGDGSMLLIMHYPAAVALFRLLFLMRMTENWLKSNGVVLGRPLPWSELARLNKECHNKKATGDKFTLPSESELDVHLRQIHWTLLYWSNAHLSLGVFPSAVSLLEGSNGRTLVETSLWGWLSVPGWATVDEGMNRTLRDRLDHAMHTTGAPLKQLLEHPLSSEVNGDTAEDREEKKKQHICHARRVAPQEAIWAQLIGEWLVGLYGAAEASKIADESSSSESDDGWTL